MQSLGQNQWLFCFALKCLFNFFCKSFKKLHTLFFYEPIKQHLLFANLKKITNIFLVLIRLSIFYPTLGTIHKLDKWESILNQFDRKPKSRWKTRFYLYTRQNPKKGQELCIDDRPTLMHSHFDPNKRVIFLISGWLDNRFFAKWVREAVRHLLNRGDFNVIYVAWRSIKELFVAAILIKLYSEELAEFITFLKVCIFV